MQELYSSLASKVYDVLNDYVKKQGGFTLVLDFSQQQSPVLYAADSTNITKQIIDAYNVKSGVARSTGVCYGRRPSLPSGSQAGNSKIHASSIG